MSALAAGHAGAALLQAPGAAGDAAAPLPTQPPTQLAPPLLQQLGLAQAQAQAQAAAQALLPAAAQSSAAPAPPARAPHAQHGAPGRGALPFGQATLHYAGCGCPPGWRAAAAAGGRPADAADALARRARAAVAAGLVAPGRRLRVAYVLPHHNVTGGMKMLLDHLAALRARGHFTVAVHRSDSAARAVPPWSGVEACADVVCRMHERLADVYPVSELDVVVVGIYHQARGSGGAAAGRGWRAVGCAGRGPGAGGCQRTQRGSRGAGAACPAQR
jgi:hypothetical protein